MTGSLLRPRGIADLNQLDRAGRKTQLIGEGDRPGRRVQRRAHRITEDIQILSGAQKVMCVRHVVYGARSGQTADAENPKKVTEVGGPGCRRIPTGQRRTAVTAGGSGHQGAEAAAEVDHLLNADLPARPITDTTNIVDHPAECELAVVLKKPCYNVSKAEALDYVLGYTCANDVSARDWQKDYGGGQWCRGKTFATFCPLGPCLTTADEIPNPNTLAIRTILNGQTMQDWNTNDMIFDVPTLIEFLSGSTRLAAGTVILTGTPHGVGAARKPPVFLQPGDTVTIEIDRIGSLTNPVVAETA